MSRVEHEISHGTGDTGAASVGATGATSAGATGAEPPQQLFLRRIKFDRYEVLLRLTADGRFVDIAEIRVSADFRTPEQQLASARSADVDDFYRG